MSSITLAPWESAVVSATLEIEFASTPLPTVLSLNGFFVVCHLFLFLDAYSILRHRSTLSRKFPHPCICGGIRHADGIFCSSCSYIIRL